MSTEGQGGDVVATIREVLSKITPGPWARATPDSNFLKCPKCDQGEYVAKAIDSMYGPPHHMDEDADFIAGAAGLLRQAADELEAARRDRAMHIGAINRTQDAYSKVQAERDAYRGTLADTPENRAALAAVIAKHIDCYDSVMNVRAEASEIAYIILAALRSVAEGPAEPAREQFDVGHCVTHGGALWSGHCDQAPASPTGERDCVAAPYVPPTAGVAVGEQPTKQVTTCSSWCGDWRCRSAAVYQMLGPAEGGEA